MSRQQERQLARLARQEGFVSFSRLAEAQVRLSRREAELVTLLAEIRE